MWFCACVLKGVSLFIHCTCGILLQVAICGVNGYVCAYNLSRCHDITKTFSNAPSGYLLENRGITECYTGLMRKVEDESTESLEVNSFAL